LRTRRIEGELEEDILYDVLQSSCHAAQPLVGLNGLTVVGQVQLGYWWVAWGGQWKGNVSDGARQPERLQLDRPIKVALTHGRTKHHLANSWAGCTNQ